MNDSFEEELREAMRRVDAPRGFADRITQQIAQSPAPVLQMPLRPAALRWAGGALAASLLVGSGAAWVERKHHRQQQRAAEQQFALAMQVTSHALQDTRQQLSRAGFRLVD